MDKRWKRKWEGDIVTLMIFLETKSKARGQNVVTKMSDCNKLWSVYAMDGTGPMSKDAGER
jgi:hypothetical protein